MTPKRQGLWPALTLFFLAPVVGELLSGSAPPAEFFNPIVLLLLAALYGSGAILVRELRVRWGKGWLSVFVLGAAYAIVEEGLMVKSFFDPGWMDLGVLGVYGRWAGVNWVWTLELTIYHAVFSIAIPILLVEMVFPARRDDRWVGRRGMIGLSFLLLADVLLGFFFLTPYRPPLVPTLLAILAVGTLIGLARLLPGRRSPAAGAPAAAPLSGHILRRMGLTLLGFGATLAFFFVVWALPGLGVPAPITLASVVVLVVLAAGLAWFLSRGGAWTDRHRLALAGGALTFFVLLAPLQELDQARPDDTTGMTLVGLATLAFLIWLWRRVRGGTRPAASPNPTPARTSHPPALEELA